MPFEEKRNPNLLSLVLTVLVIVVIVGYLIPLVGTGDPGWFMSGASHDPSELVIWQQGTPLSLKPGEPDFAMVNTEVQRTLNNVVAYSDFGPSEETLKATRDGLALEVLYAEPLTIHTQWNLGKPTRLMYPLSGYYLPDRRFFLGQEDKYRAGGPQVDNVDKLVSLVTQVLARRGELLPTATPSLLGVKRSN